MFNKVAVVSLKLRLPSCVTTMAMQTHTTPLNLGEGVYIGLVIVPTLVRKVITLINEVSFTPVTL